MASTRAPAHSGYTRLGQQDKDDPPPTRNTTTAISALGVSAATPGGNSNDVALLGGTPAYGVIQGLLTDAYRVNRSAELSYIRPNSTRCTNLALQLLCTRCCGVHCFEVSTGFVRLALNGSGGYMMYGPGVHRVTNVFFTLLGEQPMTDEVIVHGDRTILTVKQGHIGYCEDMGQPVLLPPGMHEWQSETLKFVRGVDLNKPVIELGPYTLLTVDEGYSAITQNNGKQVVFPGGSTHLLTHRNWKFEKFMTEKIQTNDLQRIEATSADNVMMFTDATVVWQITDVLSAARFSAETMHGGSSVGDKSDISKLRNDVLKQATASLASFIGGIKYSDSFHVSAAGGNATTGIPISDNKNSPIFDLSRMATAVEGANLVTATYGVTIKSINIISAIPADKELQQALAKGAVAAAEAEQAETVANGDKKASIIRAEGEATAAEMIARGAQKAANLLSENPVAIELARIEKVGQALDNKGSHTLFFGAEAHDLGGLMSNPAMVAPPRNQR